MCSSNWNSNDGLQGIVFEESVTMQNAFEELASKGHSKDRHFEGYVYYLFNLMNKNIKESVYFDCNMTVEWTYQT